MVEGERSITHCQQVDLGLDMSTESTTRRWNSLLWVWSMAVVVLTLSILFSEGMSHPRGESPLALPMYVMLPGLFTVLGTAIAVRQPGNRIAYLFLFMGLCLLVSVWADFQVGLSAPSDPTVLDALAVVWFDAGFQLGIFIPLGLLLHIFPTGRVLSRRWRWAWWAAGVCALVSLFAELSVTEVSPNLQPGLPEWWIPNPIGFTDTGTMGHPTYAVVIGLTFLPLLFGGVASIILRYRRSDAQVRAQVRWVVFALMLMVVVGLGPTFVGYYGANIFLALALIPASVTIAIARYRLFDIDRLISRTVGYAIVIGLLAALFALVTTLPGLLVGGFDSEGEAASAPPLLVAASTLAVAVLFNPVRQRVLGWVDRRFNRSRYDAELVVEQFGERLRDETDLENIAEEAVAAILTTLEPSSVGLWVRDLDT